MYNKVFVILRFFSQKLLKYFFNNENLIFLKHLKNEEY